jgi:hypothetical protein
MNSPFISGILLAITSIPVFGQEFYQLKVVIPEYLKSIVAYQYLHDRPMNYVKLVHLGKSLPVHYSVEATNTSCEKIALYYDLPTNEDYNEGDEESINVPIDPPKGHPLFERTRGLEKESIFQVTDENGKVILKKPISESRGSLYPAKPLGNYNFIKRDGMSVSHNLFTKNGKLYVSIAGVIKIYDANSISRCN